MSDISVMPSDIAAWLSQQSDLAGIRFVTEFPPSKKEIPLRRVTVAVGIKELKIEDSFTENDEGVLIKNEYCRLATITLKLGVHVPYSEGGAKCHDVLTNVIDCLTFATNLNVEESGCGSVKADRDTDAFVLESYARLKADFCPAESSSLNFKCFLDKELLCGSHIRNDEIHVTAPDKALWNAPYVIGSYTGTGTSSRSISLGFKPRLVLLFCADLPAATVNFSSSKLTGYLAFGCGDFGSQGLTVNSSGFRTAQSSAYSGSSSNLNEIGRTYVYAAFRV